MPKEQDMRVKEGRDDMPIFIHSELDDYGLTCVEFRVYGRVARRAGGGGQHLESAARMAREFEVSEATVRRALKLLVLCNLVTKEVRPGKTSVYRLQPKRMWVAREQVKALRERVLYREHEGAETEDSAAAPLSPETGVALSPRTGVAEAGTVTRDGGGLSSQRGVVLSPETDEGTPLEGTPSKVLPTHTHAPGRSAAEGGVCVSDDLTEDDYLAYARAHKSFTTPEAWAYKHWDLRDRDKLVREWKERQAPEAIARARAEQPTSGKTFGEWAQMIQSFKDGVPGYDVAGFIEAMDADEGMRELLRAEFLRREVAAG